MMKELLFSVTKKDIDINFFSGSGAGGQHRNKHQNCVRMFHRDSGARSIGQSHREKNSNLREAFKSLVEKPEFKLWHARRVMEETSGETTEETVSKMMAIENLKIESVVDGKWDIYK